MKFNFAAFVLSIVLPSLAWANCASKISQYEGTSQALVAVEKTRLQPDLTGLDKYFNLNRAKISRCTTKGLSFSAHYKYQNKFLDMELEVYQPGTPVGKGPVYFSVQMDNRSKSTRENPAIRGTLGKKSLLSYFKPTQECQKMGNDVYTQAMKYHVSMGGFVKLHVNLEVIQRNLENSSCNVTFSPS